MEKEIENAFQVLSEGGIILYPTDTIWGIGCDATNDKAVKRVYELKKRAKSKALIKDFENEYKNSLAIKAYFVDLHLLYILYRLY